MNSDTEDKLDLFPVEPETSTAVNILFDISVLAHAIAYRFHSKYKGKLHLLRNYCHACIHRVAGGYTLLDNGSPTRVKSIIGCVDTKIPRHGYWRHKYLKEQYGINYKVRNSTSYVDALTSVRAYLLQALETVGSSLAISGYEADDIASYFVQAMPAEEKIALFTVDSDWLGLLEEGRSCWVGIANSRVSYVSRVDQLHVKLGEPHPYQSFEEVWDVKARYGDKSDSLPANSPLEVINLLTPPDEYNLTKTLGCEPALEVWDTAQGNLSKARAIQATDWLKTNRLWFSPQTVDVIHPCPLFG